MPKEKVREEGEGKCGQNSEHYFNTTAILQRYKAINCINFDI
jgi:hypothetical protein